METAMFQTYVFRSAPGASKKKIAMKAKSGQAVAKAPKKRFTTMSDPFFISSYHFGSKLFGVTMHRKPTEEERALGRSRRPHCVAKSKEELELRNWAPRYTLVCPSAGP